MTPDSGLEQKLVPTLKIPNQTLITLTYFEFSHGPWFGDERSILTIFPLYLSWQSIFPGPV